MSAKAYHIPQGNPCSLCGLSAVRHRVDHAPIGNPCRICQLDVSKHRVRLRKHRDRVITYIGIDGEGYGREKHNYVLLSAADERGDRKWFVESHQRLTTKQCLNFICSLPTARTKIFSYSFNYDLTKILEDLPNELIYKLFRPDLRKWPGGGDVEEDGSSLKEQKGPKPIKWEGYKLNLQGTKFTVQRGKEKPVVIWDLFKFFQGKFVTALKDWKVGDPSLWARMSSMKDQRAEFDKLYIEAKKQGLANPQAIKDYNFEECLCMAQLARKLTDAHTAAKLKLTSYYGAGSTAKAILAKIGIRHQIRKEPEQMKLAVASAFHGGRFENYGIGPFYGTLYNWDIASAYPYQTTFLPCLLHGRWERTKSRSRMVNAEHALVRYDLIHMNTRESWGPFPFREANGSISYPIASGGGWIWRNEYLIGESLFPNVRFLEAWVYHRECNCQPFKDIPRYYHERLKLGKEGPGIVLKLGINACYGSLAQSVGNAIFNSWIWAGMITSGCRAQILEMMGLHKDRGNLLMIATDGIVTREELEPPAPRDTGTFDAKDSKDGKYKPLGAWEGKTISKGMFLARPGVYFPLNPTKAEIKEIRGRGVGKGVILENWELIVRAWRRNGVHGAARVANVSRFCGAKTSVHRGSKSGLYSRSMGSIKKQEPRYGQWITRQVELTFNPMPKRLKVNPDGKTLMLRTFPSNQESMPYDKAIRSPEGEELERAYMEAIEQPDADLTDYENGFE